MGRHFILHMLLYGAIPLVLFQLSAAILMIQKRKNRMIQFRLPILITVSCILSAIIGTFAIASLESTYDFNIWYKTVFLYLLPSVVFNLTTFRSFTYLCSFKGFTIDIITGKGSKLKEIVVNFNYFSVILFAFYISLSDGLFGFFQLYPITLVLVWFIDLLILLNIRKMKEGYHLKIEMLLILIMKSLVLLVMIINIPLGVLLLSTIIPSITAFYPLFMLLQERYELEISGRRQHFDRNVLENSLLIERVCTLAEERFCSELTDFLIDYKNKIGLDRLFYTYIQKNSEKEVNLESSMQNELIEAFVKDEIQYSQFEKVEKYVKNMLFDNVASLYFKRYIDGVDELKV